MKGHTKGIDTTELLHELGATRQQKPPKVLSLVTAKKNIQYRDSVLSLHAKGLTDGQEFGSNIWVVDGRAFAFQLCEYFECFLLSVFQQEPPGGLGHKEQGDRDEDGENKLEAKRKTPLQRTTLEIQPIADPVGEAESRRVAERANHDKFATDVWFGAFRLVDRAHRRGQSHAEAIDDSTHEQLGQMP